MCRSPHLLSNVGFRLSSSAVSRRSTRLLRKSPLCFVSHGMFGCVWNLWCVFEPCRLFSLCLHGTVLVCCSVGMAYMYSCRANTPKKNLQHGCLTPVYIIFSHRDCTEEIFRLLKRTVLKVFLKILNHVVYSVQHILIFEVVVCSHESSVFTCSHSTVPKKVKTQCFV